MICQQMFIRAINGKKVKYNIIILVNAIHVNVFSARNTSQFYRNRPIMYEDYCIHSILGRTQS